MKVDIYITVDSLAQKRTKKRFACLLICVLQDGRTHKSGIFGEVTGTYHHVILTAMEAALKRLNYSCNVNLYANDGHVLGMLKNFLPMWAKKNFQTSKGKTVANMKEWQQVWKLAKIHNVTPIPGIHKYEDDLKKQIKLEFSRKS